MLLKRAVKQRIQVAEETPYDPDKDPDCDLEQTDVQSAIDELCKKIDNSLSPGFTWGRSGTVVKGAYLLNDEVPSNVVGRRVSFSGAVIREIAVDNELEGISYDVQIYEHEGNEVSLTLLHTVNVVGSSGGNFTGLNVSVTTGRQLAVRIGSGSTNNPKNVGVSVQLKGTF